MPQGSTSDALRIHAMESCGRQPSDGAVSLHRGARWGALREDGGRREGSRERYTPWRWRWRPAGGASPAERSAPAGVAGVGVGALRCAPSRQRSGAARTRGATAPAWAAGGSSPVNERSERTRGAPGDGTGDTKQSRATSGGNGGASKDGAGRGRGALFIGAVAPLEFPLWWRLAAGDVHSRAAD